MSTTSVTVNNQNMLSTTLGNTWFCLGSTYNAQIQSVKNGLTSAWSNTIGFGLP